MTMNMSNVRILIVEDEILIAMHLARQLEEAGYEVSDPVTSGSAALEAAELNRPDVVLLDVRLAGDMDGIETGRAIRDRLGIPVVFLTGYSDPEVETRAREITSADVLGKPASVRQIAAAIGQVVRRNAAGDAT